MQSDKLERAKRERPTLAPLIDKVAAYLDSLAARGVGAAEPKLVAAALSISEAEALALMLLFERAGLLKRRYEIVCPDTHAVLATVDSKDEIAAALEELDEACKFCEKTHDLDDLEVDVVFSIVSSVKGKVPGRAA